MRKKLIESLIFTLAFQIMIYIFIYKNTIPQNKGIVVIFFLLSLLNIIITNLKLIKNQK